VIREECKPYDNNIVLMPPLYHGDTAHDGQAGHDGPFVEKLLRGKRNEQGKIRFSFEMESKDRGQVRFEWRMAEMETDVTLKFRPVAAVASSPSPSPLGDADSHGTLAVLRHESASAPGKLLTLKLLGRGQPGELGERWSLMVVMGALRVFTIGLRQYMVKHVQKS
jgi:hypothetical protein